MHTNVWPYVLQTSICTFKSGAECW